MTREEFADISSWIELQEVMIEHNYYGYLDGDLYIDEYDLMDGLRVAAQDWACVSDIPIDELTSFDHYASCWVVSPGFLDIQHYYDDEFDAIKEDFEEYLDEHELFGDDESENETAPEDEEVASEDFVEQSCVSGDMILELLFE